MANISKAERERRAAEAAKAEDSHYEDLAASSRAQAQAEHEAEEADQLAALKFTPIADLGLTSTDEFDAHIDAQHDDSHLIPVTKDGETMRVHPTALRQHAELGWRIAEA